MIRNGWRLAGWVWVAVMNLLGLGVLFFQAVFLSNEQLAGQGTALLLVGACLLFAAVFATWDWKKNKLAAFASFSTAVFGFLGTSYTLAEQNPLLLALLGVIALYSIGLGLIVAFLIRSVIEFIQTSRRHRNG